MDNVKTFCKLVRNRSWENKKGMSALRFGDAVVSPMVSILRQELDSMIRVIYLLSIDNLKLRRRLINCTLAGKKWQVAARNGIMKTVTDRDMVELSQKLHGWTKSVYKFGCSFIHLSNFHNYVSKDPFQSLPKEEQKNIIEHLRYYHGGPCSDHPTIQELSRYFPQVLEKISSNLECYLKSIEKDEMIKAKEI